MSKPFYEVKRRKLMTIDVTVFVVIGVILLAIVGKIAKCIFEVLEDVLAVFFTGVKIAIVATAVVSTVYFVHNLI